MTYSTSSMPTRYSLRNIRFYSFDVINGISVIIELDRVEYDDSFVGFEEYGGNRSSEAFSKFLQAHHGTWSFPWMPYRVESRIENLARQLHPSAGRVTSYYSHPSFITGTSVDIQFLDLYLGEVGAFTKVFAFTPFSGLTERLWFKALGNLNDLIQTPAMSSSSSKVCEPLKHLLSLERMQDRKDRLNVIAEIVARIAPIGSDISTELSSVKQFLTDIAKVVMNSIKFDKLAVILPFLHVLHIAEELGRKLCKLFMPNEIKLWFPTTFDWVKKNDFENLLRKGLEAENCRCSLASKTYYVDFHFVAIGKTIDNVLDTVINDMLKDVNAVIVCIDAPKRMLYNLLLKAMDRRIPVFVASPRISLKEGKHPHITGIPIEIVHLT